MKIKNIVILVAALLLQTCEVCHAQNVIQWLSQKGSGTMRPAADKTIPDSIVPGIALHAIQCISWTLDSTMIALYQTTFDRTWFRTGSDSIQIDSLGGKLRGAGTESITIRIYWGQSIEDPVDSLDDLEITSFTTGTVAAGDKTIPPESDVGVKIISLTGYPVYVPIYMDVRRKW